MVVYVKYEGRLLTLKELAQKFNVSDKLVRGRWTRGIRDIEELVEPRKYEELGDD